MEWTDGGHLQRGDVLSPTLPLLSLHLLRCRPDVLHCPITVRGVRCLRYWWRCGRACLGARWGAVLPGCLLSLSHGAAFTNRVRAASWASKQLLTCEPWGQRCKSEAETHLCPIVISSKWATNRVSIQEDPPDTETTLKEWQASAGDMEDTVFS